MPYQQRVQCRFKGLSGPARPGRVREDAPVVSLTVRASLKETRDACATYPRAPGRLRPIPSRLFIRQVPVAFGRVPYTSWPTSTSTLVRSSGFQVGTPMVSLTPR